MLIVPKPSSSSSGAFASKFNLVSNCKDTPPLLLSKQPAAKMDSTSAEVEMLPPPSTTTDDEENDDVKQQPLNGKDESLSSSESDSESDNEEQQNLQLQTLQLELSNNPMNYEAHVQYIKASRKMGEIDKLREAREAMSLVFPLSPEMWREWAKDEASLRTGLDTFSLIEKLYERGVSDYLSVPLWCDYINFVEEHDPSVSECTDAGISKARNLFERALTAAGLHVSEGSKIWEAYREFEQAIFLTLDELDNQAKEKQAQRIRSIFHRQLSVPLSALSTTLLAYKAWEVEQGNALDAESAALDGITPHVSSAYQKATEMYNARAHQEEQISKKDITDSERLVNFMNYIKFEQSSGDPARVQILYERAITEFPISSDLWLDYTRYLDKILKVAGIIKNIYSRATRNCPWIGDLWVRYLLCLERCHAPENEISDVFEKSLQCSLSSIEEYLDVFLTRIDGIRRRISEGHEVQGVLDHTIIRATFERAADYLALHLKDTDSLLHLYAYWAQLELSLGKDIAAARGVWESLLKISGSTLAAWQGYVAMEINLDHINEARSIYKRCYSKRFFGTGSEDICNSWLRFEREYGTLGDYDHAIQKVTPRLEELRLFRSQQESKDGTGIVEGKQIPDKKSSHGKRKLVPDFSEKQRSAKKQKDSGAFTAKGPGVNKSEPDISVHSSKGKEIKTAVDKSVSGNDQEVKDFPPPKSKTYADECTVFISNLNFRATEEDLKKLFKDIGGVVAVRLLKDRETKKSRGLAYIDFCDDEHLVAALEKNKMMFMGKNLSVARSNPRERRKKESGRPRSSERQQESAGIFKGSKSSQTSSSSTTQTDRDDKVQIKGKVTFAVPRNVIALGWQKSKPESSDLGDEAPKSNDEFRKMLLKK